VIEAQAGLEIIRELAAVRDPDALGEEGVCATGGAVAGRGRTQRKCKYQTCDLEAAHVRYPLFVTIAL
jgi:hypothetical protein